MRGNAVKRRKSLNSSPRSLWASHACIVSAYDQRIRENLDISGWHGRGKAVDDFWKWMQSDWRVKIWETRRGLRIVTFPTSEDKVEFVLRYPPRKIDVQNW